MAWFYPIKNQYSRNLQQPDRQVSFVDGKTSRRFVAMLQNKLHVSVARFTVALTPFVWAMCSLYVLRQAEV